MYIPNIYVFNPFKMQQTNISARGTYATVISRYIKAIIFAYNV